MVMALGLWHFTPFSGILWRQVLLVEETEVDGQNRRPAVSH